MLEPEDIFLDLFRAGYDRWDLEVALESAWKVYWEDDEWDEEEYVVALRDAEEYADRVNDERKLR